MYEFHKDKDRYFEMQKVTSRDYVIPFVSTHIDLESPKKILEIGCAEAGVLKAFTDQGHNCVGIELSEGRIKIAETHFHEELARKQIRFISRDIMRIDVHADIGHGFDLIILKDVIEHIPNQAKFIEKLGDFLNPGGVVFFGFPPWYMPFGGHQQICKNKWLAKLPYYHLLPSALYRFILRKGGESEGTIKELQEIKDTGISIERFKRISRGSGYKIIKQQLYLFNPIYKFKFGLKPRKQLPILRSIPFIRNFYTTCGYFLIGK